MSSEAKTNMTSSKKNRQSQNKAILITGGCGFIGTNLIKYLADEIHKLRILDNLSTGKEESLKKLQSQHHHLTNVDLIVGDIRNREVVDQAVKSVDSVVHLAAHTDVVASVANPKGDWDINANGTLNLLEACRKHGVERFIFASSNAVLGEQPPPIDELKIPKPLSPYGASKLAGEALCSSYYHSFGLKTISLRFANCYGIYSEHKGSVVSRFMRCVLEGIPLTIYGDGNQTRDFIHVDDICQAIYLALTIPPQAQGTKQSFPSGEVFQIATGVETSVCELARLIREITGRELQIIHEPERKGEIKRNYANINKAGTMLGFEPKVKFRTGLNDLWEWLKKERKE